MLYYLLYHVLQKYFSPLNVFRYITVRTVYASLTAMFLALVFGPWLIRKLRELQIGQYIREEGPASAPEKSRHSDDGRRADRSFHRCSHIAVGRSAKSICVARALCACWRLPPSVLSTTTPKLPSAATSD